VSRSLEALVSWGLVAAVTAAFTFGGCNGEDRAVQDPEPWVRSAECGFVDAAGMPVVLRGFNLIAPESPAVWKAADSLGANFVRIPVTWSEVEPAPPDGEHHWNLGLLKALDRELAYFRERRIYVLLDFHQFRWSAYFGEDAEGIPAWFYERQDNPPASGAKHQAIADWWHDPAAFAAYSEFVSMMVRRYRAFPNVLGYEVLNEPATGALGEDHAATQAVLAWQARVRDVISDLDPQRTVFIQTRGGGDLGLKNADFSAFGSLENVALDLHAYFSAEPGTGYSTDGERWIPDWEGAHLHGNRPYMGTEARQEAMIRVALDKAQELGVPLLVGEWGARNDDPNADVFQAQMLSIFARHGLSWARWDLGTNPTFGLLHPSPAARGLAAQLRAALATRVPPSSGCESES
jgi:Cellulase (glycosyl hydrolase family 5)